MSQKADEASWDDVMDGFVDLPKEDKYELEYARKELHKQHTEHVTDESMSTSSDGFSLEAQVVKLRQRWSKSGTSAYNEGKYERARLYYAAAAQYSDATSSFTAGACALRLQCPANAAYFFGKAGRLGHADAQFALATLYEIGNGVPRDVGRAVEWHSRAAMQGHARARAALCLLNAPVPVEGVGFSEVRGPQPRPLAVLRGSNQAATMHVAETAPAHATGATNATFAQRVAAANDA